MEKTNKSLRIVGNLIVDDSGMTIAIVNLPSIKSCERMVECFNACRGLNLKTIETDIKALLDF